MDNIPVRHFILRTSGLVALLTFGYYVLPEGAPRSGEDAGRLAVAAATMAVWVLVVRRLLINLRDADRPLLLRIESLLASLYVIILFFASVYYRLGVNAEDEIVGIANRTDALYFSVTIVSTVGFGDINASGTTARAFVTVHMLVNLLYIGTALRLVGSRAGSGRYGAQP